MLPKSVSKSMILQHHPSHASKIRKQIDAISASSAAKSASVAEVFNMDLLGFLKKE
jgi:hypothetical protein